MDEKRRGRRDFGGSILATLCKKWGMIDVLVYGLGDETVYWIDGGR